MLIFILWIFPLSSIWAYDFHVNDKADLVDTNLNDGKCETAADTCTLRAAVMQANAQPDKDHIILQAETYFLDQKGSTEGSSGLALKDSVGDLDVTDFLVVSGVSPTTTIIDASKLDDRLFHVGKEVTLTLHNVTIQRGITNGAGGGILSMSEGILSIKNTIVRQNNAYAGGGISANGPIQLVESTIIENSADPKSDGSGGKGGGILFNSIFQLFDSSVVGNHAVVGGGIMQMGSTGNVQGIIRNSTVANNVAMTVGGLSIRGGPDGKAQLEITNSTISSNLTKHRDDATQYPFPGAGGIMFYHGDAVIDHATIVNNVTHGDGGGIRIFHGKVPGSPFSPESSVIIRNSIVAGNIADGDEPGIVPGVVGNDCSGPMQSEGYNIMQDLTGCLVEPAENGTDLFGVKPYILPLADNGGKTETHLLIKGSPAIDAANPTIDALTLTQLDQRGVQRSVDGNGDGTEIPDIGAVEMPQGFQMPHKEPLQRRFKVPPISRLPKVPQ